MARVAFFIGPELNSMAHAECLKRAEYAGVVDAYIMHDSADEFTCDICLGSDPDKVELMLSEPILKEVIAAIHSETTAMPYIMGFYPGDHGPRCDCGDCPAPDVW